MVDVLLIDIPDNETDDLRCSLIGTTESVGEKYLLIDFWLLILSFEACLPPTNHNMPSLVTLMEWTCNNAPAWYLVLLGLDVHLLLALVYFQLSSL